MPGFKLHGNISLEIAYIRTKLMRVGLLFFIVLNFEFSLSYLIFHYLSSFFLDYHFA